MSSSRSSRKRLKDYVVSRLRRSFDVCQLPEWLPDWLKEALSQPTMDVPSAGKAVFDAPRQQSYVLAGKGILPTVKAQRTRRVPTIWVRRMLMLDNGPGSGSSR